MFDPVYISGCFSLNRLEKFGQIISLSPRPGIDAARQIADLELAPSDLARASVEGTLKACDLTVNDTDLVISCTQTPDHNNPGLVCPLLAKLGGTGVPGMELKNSAAGPLYALHLAACMITSGTHRKIVVSGCDTLSRYFVKSDEEQRQQLRASSIYADGAGSFLVGSSQNLNRSDPCFKLIDVTVGTLSCGADSYFIAMPCAYQFPLRITENDVQEGRHLPVLDQEKFVAAFDEEFPSIFEQFTEKNSGPINAIMPHSPIGNRFIRSISARYGKTSFYDIFDKSGYIGAAGVPTNLSLYAESFPVGARILIVAGGAGPSFGLALVERI